MWEPGTLVECVDDDGWEDAFGEPIAGPRVRDVCVVTDGCAAFGTTFITVSGYDRFFEAIGFRPLSESRLSIFRSLLTPTPKTVNVGEEA